MAEASLTTLTGVDLTATQITGMIAELDQFILTNIQDGTSNLVYTVDGLSVDRAKALAIAMQLRDKYEMLLRSVPAEETMLAEDPGLLR